MIGARVGVVPGARVGPAIGVSADELSAVVNPMSSVSRDSTSLIYCPASNAEWSTTMTTASLVSGNPTGLWLCQEPSGSLADSIGTNTLTLTGAPTFHGVNTGWARFSVNITSTAGQAFSFGTGPFSPLTVSVAWLWYGCAATTPGGSRMLLVASSAVNGLNIVHLPSNKLQLNCGVNTATSVNSYTTSTIFPMLLVYNVTALSCTLYTGLEALSVVFAAGVPDGLKGFGAVAGLSSDGSEHTTYLAAFAGGAAELSTAGARSLFTTLGWSPAF